MGLRGGEAAQQGLCGTGDARKLYYDTQHSPCPARLATRPASHLFPNLLGPGWAPLSWETHAVSIENAVWISARLILDWVNYSNPGQ